MIFSNSFVTLEYLQDVREVKFNFLEYETIKNKIKNLKITFNNNNTARPVIPNILNIIQLGGILHKKFPNVCITDMSNLKYYIID